MVDGAQFLSSVALGLSVAFSAAGLFYCLTGVTLGMLIGVLPGMGAMASISLLMPITLYLDPTFALIMLGGIYYGSAYGGSTASILLNLPGTPSSAVTCLDGYPMARSGRAGVALFLTTIASFVGSFIGTLALAFFSPVLAQIALRFSAQEYFSLMVLGLLASALLSGESRLRGITMIVFGLILGIVGMDVGSGRSRMTFGFPELFDGLPVVAVALALFALPEVIANAGRLVPVAVSAREVTLRSMLPTRDDWQRFTAPALRGTGIGAVLGVLPGTGGVLASFMSYAIERHIHKTPEKFGTGMVEGVVSPEAANNSAVQTAFIPTLTLGIPGDAVMALMMGVLIIHGVYPGPQLISQSPDLFWGVVVSFLIGNLALVILNIPMIGLWVQILTIPYKFLFPAIVVFICLGVYSVRYAVSDIFIVLVLGLIGYMVMILKFQPAQLVLGFILGPLLEENFRRSLQLSRGEFTTFIHRPLSAFFVALSVMLILWTIYSEYKLFRRRRTDRAW